MKVLYDFANPYKRVMFPPEYFLYKGADMQPEEFVPTVIEVSMASELDSRVLEELKLEDPQDDKE